MILFSCTLDKNVALWAYQEFLCVCALAHIVYLFISRLKSVDILYLMCLVLDAFPKIFIWFFVIGVCTCTSAHKGEATYIWISINPTKAESTQGIAINKTYIKGILHT